MNDGISETADWIGRSEDARDTFTAGPVERLATTLDRDVPPLAVGDAIPPLAHWLFFLPQTRQSEIGADGHARRGGFLPALTGFPRRMWAGSRLTFVSDLRVGDDVIRQSRINSVKPKMGASGAMVFVTVHHEYARPGETPALVDEHDIVYRSLDAPAVSPAPRQMEPGAWRRELTPDPVLLFRYSALTFNGHRIHYDRDYVMRQEGYPGLVVHGPLIATLLLDLVGRNAPQARIESFSFRAVSPLFDGNVMSVNATPPDTDGRITLWAANADGGLAMSAEARIS